MKKLNIFSLPKIIVLSDVV